MLGVASVQGLAVASFNKDDAGRLLFFSSKREKDKSPKEPVFSGNPSWLRPPAPSRKRSELCSRTKSINTSSLKVEDIGSDRQKSNCAAMRPVPHSQRQKILPFSGLYEGERYNGDHGKSQQLPAPIKHHVSGLNSVTHRKSVSNSFQASQIISLNPLPMKKHGCDRAPIRACSEVVSTYPFVDLCYLPCYYVLFDPSPDSDIALLMHFMSNLNLTFLLLFLFFLAGGIPEGCDAVSDPSRAYSSHPSRWAC